MPIAYSYVRFSSAKQELGDSLRRQLTYARTYAQTHNLTLSEVSYRDLGVSGYRAKNIERGAFAGFISAVESGRIAPGSFLLIEQFDRLTRADLDTAHQLFRRVLLLDISIVTLVDGKTWTKDSLKNLPDLVMSILLMARSHEESKAKSERLAEVWGAKKKAAASEGRVITSQCPKWLKVKADKSGFEVIPEMAESVQRVYRHWLAGLGSNAICSLANEQKWPQPGNLGKGWQPSLVKRLLLNRAVLGEYQPHLSPDDTNPKRRPDGNPVRGYFPTVIDEATFLQAQAVRGRYGAFPGRRDGLYKNWLAHLLECTCGRSIVRANKAGPRDPESVRYYCSGRTRKLTNCEGVSAYELESAILNGISYYVPVQIDTDAKTQALQRAIDELDARHADGVAVQGRLIDAIKLSTGLLPALVAELELATATLAKCKQEMAAKRAELADMPTNASDLFYAIAQSISRREDVEARAALQQSISRIIEKFVVDVDTGHITARLRGQSKLVVFPFRSDARLVIKEEDEFDGAADDLNRSSV